jgi:hypothetical protein
MSVVKQYSNVEQRIDDLELRATELRRDIVELPDGEERRSLLTTVTQLTNTLTALRLRIATTDVRTIKD